MRKMMWILCLIPYPLMAQMELSLEDCHQMALEHNQQVEIAAERVKAAEAMERAAFTAFLPQISFTGSYTRLNRDFSLLSSDLFLPVIPYTALDASTGGLSSSLTTDPTLAASVFAIDPSTGSIVTNSSGDPVFQQYAMIPQESGEISLRNIYVANLGLIQPIYMGGKIREAHRISEYTVDLAKSNEKLSREELLYNTDEAYFRLLTVLEKKKMAEQYSGLMDELVTDLENLLKEGIITSNELLSARVKQNEATLMVLRAENGESLSRIALNQILGLDFDTELILADSFMTIADSIINTEQLQNSAMENRPEIDALSQKINIAESNVRLMKSRFLPNLGFTGNFLMTNPNPYKGLTEEFGGDVNLGLVCNIPIYHFGERRHTLKAANYEMNASRLELEEAQEKIRMQVEKTVHEWEEAVMSLSIAKLGLEQATENLRQSKMRFDNGMISSTELMKAQTLWQEAASRNIDARMKLRLSYTTLLKNSGQLMNQNN